MAPEDILSCLSRLRSLSLVEGIRCKPTNRAYAPRIVPRNSSRLLSLIRNATTAIDPANSLDFEALSDKMLLSAISLPRYSHFRGCVDSREIIADSVSTERSEWMSYSVEKTRHESASVSFVSERLPVPLAGQDFATLTSEPTIQ
jgi:hypothetical protein